MAKITVGEKIEQYVDYLGYTNIELENTLGFNSHQMLSIYRNEYIPNENEIKKFAILFNVTPENLSNNISIDENGMQENFLENKKLTAHDEAEIKKFQNYLKIK